MYQGGYMLKSRIIVLVLLVFIFSACSQITGNSNDDKIYSFKCTLIGNDTLSTQSIEVDFSKESVIKYIITSVSDLSNDTVNLANNYFALSKNGIEPFTNIDGVSTQVTMDSSQIITKKIEIINDHGQLDINKLSNTSLKYLIKDGQISPSRIYKNWANIDDELRFALGKNDFSNCTGDIKEALNINNYEEIHNKIYDDIKVVLTTKFNMKTIDEFDTVIFNNRENVLEVTGNFVNSVDSMIDSGSFKCTIVKKEIDELVKQQFCNNISVDLKKDLIAQLDNSIINEDFRNIIKYTHKLLSINLWDQYLDLSKLNSYDQQFIYRYLHSGFLSNNYYIDKYLNVSLMNTVDEYRLSNWNDIVQISSQSPQHIVGLRSDGSVVSSRNILNGEYNQDNFEEYSELDVSNWSDIIQVDTGSHFTVGLKSNGEVEVTGNEYNDVKDWTDIVYIEAAKDVIFGIDSSRNIYYSGDVSDSIYDNFFLGYGYYSTNQIKIGDNYDVANRLEREGGSTTTYRDFESKVIYEMDYYYDFPTVWSETAGICNYVFLEDGSIVYSSLGEINYSEACDSFISPTKYIGQVAFSSIFNGMPVTLSNDGRLFSLDWYDQFLSLAKDALLINLKY